MDRGIKHVRLFNLDNSKLLVDQFTRFGELRKLYHNHPAVN